MLARSAGTPGFPLAAGRLFAELQAAHVEPARFTAGLRRWAAEAAPDRAAYADEVASLYSAYRNRLEALGRVDAEGRAWAILDALRADPAAWGGRPVFLYGFDDLTAAQLDAVETLVRVCDAPVTLSLTYEAGRAAFADRAATVETLRPLADEVVELPERADHYAPASRPALHHLERRLFDPGPEDPVTPNGTIRLLEAGGERAEAELIAATLLELAEDGMSPGDMAVLTGGAEGRALLGQVLADHGLPVDRAERVPLGRTRLGAGVLGFARCALPGGTATDLLAWLRTPGKVADPAAVDAVERVIRRLGVRTVAEALRLRELERLDPRARRVLVAADADLELLRAAIDPARGAATRPAPSRSPAPGFAGLPTSSVDEGGHVGEPPRSARPATPPAGVGGSAGEPSPEAAAQAVLDAIVAEMDATWVAPYTREGAVLAAAGTADARVAAEVRRAAKDLVSLAALDPALVGDAAALVQALAGVEVRLGGSDPSRPAITVADPLDVRARRFRAVVVCGLQDDVFPRRANAEPFLDDDDRRALARASGIVLKLHEDALPAERYRFYAAVSRAQEALLLAFRATDEDGEPQLRSPFVDDVLDCFTDELWTARGRRLLAEVTWPPAQAPTPLELRRAQAVASAAEGPPVAQPHEPEPIVSPVVAARQAARATTGAGDLEAFAACGVRYLVERVLRPERIDPDPEPLKRGSRAHDVLERTLTLLKERTGSARLTPERHAVAHQALRDALAEQTATRAQEKADLLSLEADLGRWLKLECESGPGFEPQALEWSFGGADDAHGPLDLGAVKVTGRVDRVDVGPGGEAVVRDYKSSRGFPLAKWEEEGRMQAALYAVAVRELLGLDPAGAVYQPLRGRDLRARGAARAGSAAAGLVRSDVVDAQEWDEVLTTMTAEARAAAERLLAGELRPCPERCTSRGCAYPAICRAPGSEPAPVEPA